MPRGQKLPPREGYVDELKKEGKVSYTSTEGKGNEREYKLEDDNAANTPWAEWPVDIELSFDKDVAAGSVTFYGKYQNYDNGTEVSQINADQITAGTVYRLLRDMRGEIVYDFDYEVMAGFVQDFIGGARYDGNGTSFRSTANTSPTTGSAELFRQSPRALS